MRTLTDIKAGPASTHANCQDNSCYQDLTKVRVHKVLMESMLKILNKTHKTIWESKQDATPINTKEALWSK